MPGIRVILQHTLQISIGTCKISAARENRGQAQKRQAMFRVQRKSLFPAGLRGRHVSLAIGNQSPQVVHLRVCRPEAISGVEFFLRGVQLVRVQCLDDLGKFLL